MRHKSQTNVSYRPRLHVTVRWTWRGRTHYVEVGEPVGPPFPGGVNKP